MTLLLRSYDLYKAPFAFSHSRTIWKSTSFAAFSPEDETNPATCAYSYCSRSRAHNKWGSSVINDTRTREKDLTARTRPVAERQGMGNFKRVVLDSPYKSTFGETKKYRRKPKSWAYFRTTRRRRPLRRCCREMGIFAETNVCASRITSLSF